MKSKSVLVLLAVFLALLAVVLFLKPRVKDETGMILVDLKPEDVRKVSLTRGAEVLAFEKAGQGDWTIVRPLVSPADTFEVSRLAEDFATLRYEKVVEERVQDPSEFGLPRAEVRLWTAGENPAVTIVLGLENPLDKTIYAQKSGDPRVVLLSSLIKSTLDKTLLDFRQKDIFRFETAEAGSVRLKSKEADWRADLRPNGWFLQKPLTGLIQKTQMDGLLATLSGLRAKEFVSEAKSAAEIKAFGLDKPDFEVAVSLPKESRNIRFFVRRTEGKVYAATDSSDKIILVEEQIFSDLDKNPETLREKRPAVFNAWEADRLEIRKGGLSLAVSRKERGPWTFQAGAAGPADESKVETFLRQIGDLEAVEFIDRPGPLSKYGLDRPEAEVKIQTPGSEGRPQETVLLFGAEDKAAKQLVVRSAGLEYMFRVSSSVLDEFPKSALEWKSAEPKDKTS